MGYTIFRQSELECELASGSVLVVEAGTILQLRNAGAEELVLFIYGAPPERGQAEFFPDVP